MKTDEKKVKKATKTQTLLRLGKYLYQYKLLMVLALFMTIASNLLALVGPKLSGAAIDAIGTGDAPVQFQLIYRYATIMILFYFISSVLSYLLSAIMVNISKRLSSRLRKDVFDHISTLPVGFFDRHQTGDIISRISYDIDTIAASLSTDVVQILTSIITVVGSFIMMLTISPLLILVFVVTIPMSVLFTKYKTKKLRPLFHRRSEKLGELNGYVEEIVSGQRTVKAYGREDVMISRFDCKNEAAVTAYYRADYYGCMVGPTVNFINNLSLAGVSIFGAIMYLAGGITLGNVSSFILYSRKFSGPINEAANILTELQSAIAAANRVFMLLDEHPEPEDAPDAKVIEHANGRVEIDNVDFGYDEGKLIIKDLSIQVPQGGLIAIVGPTGAGKTTIINLLMRFYDVNYGAIRVDATDIREITRKSLRLSYTMVLQDTWLFYGTIFENIAYGREGVTMDDVVRVAKAAKIHNFIMSLPQGYDTILSDDGINISKGQRQLLTIARAMLIDSSMLILDEATSNVDTRTERAIQDAMYALMKGRTCFVIAHRLSTIQNADCILVVNGGEIVEQGTHTELMAKKGFYSELYNAQFDQA